MEGVEEEDIAGTEEWTEPEGMKEQGISREPHKCLWASAQESQVGGEARMEP